jgi:hypothetical protein
VRFATKPAKVNVGVQVIPHWFLFQIVLAAKWRQASILSPPVLCMSKFSPLKDVKVLQQIDHAAQIIHFLITVLTMTITIVFY